METARSKIGYTSLLICLSLCALILAARVVYVFLADVNRFPINTVKVVATYQHVTHQQIEEILTNYLQQSFFLLSVKQLLADLSAIDWIKKVKIERIWPDSLKIILIEKVPVATWNNALLTKDGEIFNEGGKATEFNLPHLFGPVNQQQEVLQVYEKMSKILSVYGLQALALELRENQAWVLKLANGAQLQLGKRDIHLRLTRFCKAYPAVFSEKLDQLLSVDLRYPRGMAVAWKKRNDNG